MKNQLKAEDITILKDIAANQLNPLSKMEQYIYNIPEIANLFSIQEIKICCKDILDEVAAELGFQTKYSEICK